LSSVSQSAFQYITTRLTPGTDRECRWSYSVGKCVPKCKCKHDFKVRSLRGMGQRRGQRKGARALTKQGNHRGRQPTRTHSHRLPFFSE
jgi:hypothetical protein